jgi:putative ABC transport system permease protein
MEALLQNVRYTIRMLRKSPGFTAAALLTLTLAIGANTAIFSVVDAVVLRPLPYSDPNRLILLKEWIPQATRDPIPVSAPDVIQFQRQNSVFDGVAAFSGVQFDLSGENEPQRVTAERVNFNLFPLLGVLPVLGRGFTESEDQPGHRVAILSYGLWRSRFAGDLNAVGRTLRLDRKAYTVIGVMPHDLIFPLPGMDQGEAADLFVPMAFTHDELSTIGDNFNYGVIARLKSGVSLANVNRELEVIAHRMQETYPAQFRRSIRLGAVALPLNRKVGGNSRSPLLLLLGAVGFVLLIACANVTNLLLSRAAGRKKEIAVRLAVGAGPAQLFWQFLTESLFLSISGAALGLMLAWWSTRLLVKLMPADIPRAHVIGLNLPVLGFALTLAVFTGLIFGLAPALWAWRTDLNSTLREGGRNAALGPQRQNLRSALVVGQIALSLVLLAGAGLLVRSFARVLETNPGFQPEHVLTASLNLPVSQYQKSEQIRVFLQQLMARLEAMPGAKWAGGSSDLPLHGSWVELFTPEGYRPSPGAGLNKCNQSVILGNYLQTMGIPLLRGRTFTEQDNSNSTPVLIVSESLAKQYWPGLDPIGKRLKLGTPQSSAPWLTIVGVVGDVKQGALDEDTALHTYGPFLQQKSLFNSLNVTVWAVGEPADLASSLRAAIWGLDDQLAVAQVRTMDEIVGESTASRRFNLYLLGGFAVMALMLAAIGIYGVIAYSVGRRRQEIGIRLALGADRFEVLLLILKPGFALTLAGTGLGIAGVLALRRLMSAMLFGVRPADPLTLAAVSIVLVLASLFASYIPARRAARVDPMVALRYE